MMARQLAGLARQRDRGTAVPVVVGRLRREDDAVETRELFLAARFHQDAAEDVDLPPGGAALSRTRAAVRRRHVEALRITGGAKGRLGVDVRRGADAQPRRLRQDIEQRAGDGGLGSRGRGDDEHPAGRDARPLEVRPGCFCGYPHRGEDRILRWKLETVADRSVEHETVEGKRRGVELDDPVGSEPSFDGVVDRRRVEDEDPPSGGGVRSSASGIETEGPVDEQRRVGRASERLCDPLASEGELPSRVGRQTVRVEEGDGRAGVGRGGDLERGRRHRGAQSRQQIRRGACQRVGGRHGLPVVGRETVREILELIAQRPRGRERERGGLMGGKHRDRRRDATVREQLARYRRAVVHATRVGRQRPVDGNDPNHVEGRLRRGGEEHEGREALDDLPAACLNRERHGVYAADRAARAERRRQRAEVSLDRDRCGRAWGDVAVELLGRDGEDVRRGVPVQRRAQRGPAAHPFADRQAGSNVAERRGAGVAHLDRHLERSIGRGPTRERDQPHRDVVGWLREGREGHEQQDGEDRRETAEHDTMLAPAGRGTCPLSSRPKPAFRWRRVFLRTRRCPPGSPMLPARDRPTA